MNTHPLRAALMLAAIMLAGASHAQATGASPLPATVAYVNGGIGKNEAGRIEAQSASYNLRLMFSEGRTNAFVSDVHLRIADQAGHPLLALRDAGPLTNVKLPPGKYQVDCSFGHMQRHNSVELKDGQPVDLYLHFPHDSDAS